MDQWWGARAAVGRAHGGAPRPARIAGVPHLTRRAGRMSRSAPARSHRPGVSVKLGVAARDSGGPSPGVRRSDHVHTAPCRTTYPRTEPVRRPSDNRSGRSAAGVDSHSGVELSLSNSKHATLPGRGRLLRWCGTLLVLTAVAAGGWLWWRWRPTQHLAEAARCLEAGRWAEAAAWLEVPEKAPETREPALLLRARVALAEGKAGGGRLLAPGGPAGWPERGRGGLPERAGPPGGRQHAAGHRLVQDRAGGTSA